MSYNPSLNRTIKEEIEDAVLFNPRSVVKPSRRNNSGGTLTMDVSPNLDIRPANAERAPKPQSLAVEGNPAIALLSPQPVVHSKSREAVAQTSYGFQSIKPANYRPNLLSDDDGGAVVDPGGDDDDLTPIPVGNGLGFLITMGLLYALFVSRRRIFIA